MKYLSNELFRQGFELTDNRVETRWRNLGILITRESNGFAAWFCYTTATGSDQHHQFLNWFWDRDEAIQWAVLDGPNHLRVVKFLKDNNLTRA